LVKAVADIYSRLSSVEAQRQPPPSASDAVLPFADSILRHGIDGGAQPFTAMTVAPVATTATTTAIVHQY
jgi:hypothetical protein